MTVTGPSARALGRSVLPALAVMCLTRLSFGALALIFPVYVEVSAVATGVSLALYPLLEAFSAPVLGAYSDRVGRRRTFAAGLVSLALLNFLMALSRDFYFVSLIHALMGVSAAAITVSTLAFITDYTRQNNRGRWMGAFDMANLSGYALGFIMGTFFTQSYPNHLNFAFLVTAALLAATAVMSLFSVRDIALNRMASLKVNPFSAIDRSTRTLLPIWFSLTTILGIAFFLPKGLSSSGVAPSSSGLLLFGIVLVLGVGSIVWGAVSDHIGRYKTLAVGMVGLLLFLFALLGLVANPSDLFSAIGLAILSPLILMLSAVVPSLLAEVGDQTDQQRRGSVMGLYSLLLSLGLALGNILGGLGFHWMALTGVVLLGIVDGVANLALVLLMRFGLGWTLSREGDRPSPAASA